MNNANHSILVADDDADVLSALKLALRTEQYQVTTASSPHEVITLLERKHFSCLLIDLNYTQDTTSGIEGMSLLKEIRQRDADVPIIVITGFGSVGIAVEAMKLGACDFIEKPWRNSQLFARIKQQVERANAIQVNKKLSHENALLREAQPLNVVAHSNVMSTLLTQIERVAQSDMNVLFTGENGTGKSMLAKYLHHHSTRSNNSFISVNMGAIPESLFESEMFGHVKGAFTDAKDDRIGRFELANQGTLFLDEIANINLAQQAKLLHVLEAHQFERVGSAVTLQADVRLVSATNAPLEDLVASGQFRQDLLYRLNTVEIRIPALRERIEDIPNLATHFIQQLCTKYGTAAKSLSDCATSALLQYTWPGNIRELAHTIERGMFLSNGDIIDESALNLPGGKSKPANQKLQTTEEKTLEEIEKQVILERQHKHNKDPIKTARSLGLTRSSYYRRLEKYQLNQ